MTNMTMYKNKRPQLQSHDIQLYLMIYSQILFTTRQGTFLKADIYIDVMNNFQPQENREPLSIIKRRLKIYDH